MGRKSKKRALQGVQGAVSRAAKRRTAGDNVPKSSAFVTRCLERGLTFEDPEDNEAGDMPSNLIWIKEELSSEDVSNESFMEHPRLIQDFDVKAEIDEEFDEIENKLEIKEEPVEYHDSEYSIRFEESVGRVEDSKDFINVSNLCQLENGERASQRIRGCNLASDDSDSNRDFEKDDDGFASDEENQDDEFTPCTSTTKMKSLTDPTRQVKMGPMQMTDVEKARIPALREEKVPIKEIVRRTGKGTVAVASKRKFRNAWLEQGLFKAWLEPVEDDPHKARCKVCKSFLAAEINSLKRHARCKLHKLHEAVERTTPELNEEDNDRITIAEIKLTGFFVEHRIPFTTADHLIGLLKHLFPECSNLQKCYLKQTRVKKDRKKW
ncbi:uncharacterized protein LOC119589928 isoform X1 [Penaeus monodon]|uniref:uncharacterized protein LOC119589928 isoform X1 n=1 Tax=Penaeus monodon TaxID=6687 RepID=UPI0018A6EDE6|nr:uncharacterized protein LOC119589928 isoform X1 [Penaeus monodon]